VVLVKRMHDFLTNTTPSARLWSLRGILTSRSHPSSAEEGSRAHPNVLLIWTAVSAQEDGVALWLNLERRHYLRTGNLTYVKSWITHVWWVRRQSWDT